MRCPVAFCDGGGYGEVKGGAVVEDCDGRGKEGGFYSGG
jgi:hypothetical protein